MMNIDKVELAWAAGLFEGEGWISTQNNSPHLGIQMSDPSVLLKFQAVLKMGHIHPRSHQPKPSDGIQSRKPRWQWRVTSFELVQAALTFMWPWLSERRKAKAKEVLGLALLAKRKPRGAYKREPTADTSLYQSRQSRTVF